MLPSGSGLAALTCSCWFLSKPGFSNGHRGRLCVGFSRESFKRSFRGIKEEKRTCFPFGLHLGVPAPYLYLVSCTASPPSSESRNICGLLSARRTKASCFPSGLHTACEEPSL